jgi:type III secretion protein W
MVEEINPPERVSSPEAEKLRAQKLEAKREAKYDFAQEVSQARFEEEFAEYASFNPLAMSKKFQKLEEKVRTHEKREATEAEEEDTQETGKLERIAKNYERRTDELNSRSLLYLKSLVKKNDNMRDIIRKVTELYPDQYLADEALDFLAETTARESALGGQIAAAKEEFNETYGREIRAGRNIRNEAKLFSKEGLGSPTSLRDLYRDITGNPRPPLTLFDQLTSSFDFEQMKKVIDFLLHSLGSDLKSKGPSIDKAELVRLSKETRSLQAILGLYRFFQQRLPSIKSAFSRAQLALPAILSFEVLARELVKLLQERYPSSDKVLLLSRSLGISEEIAAQIIIFTQYRDAMRQISPKLFRSEKHRQDLLMCIIDALSDLEDMEEEEEED